MRTNKIIQYLFITSIIFVSMGVSFGETIDIENIIGAQTISGYKQITIPLLKQTSKLSYIDTRFCNDGIKPEKLTENLSMMIRPGEKKEICMIHFNNYEEDIDMFGTFPESQIYPNGSQDCSTNNTRDNPFSKFIKPFKEELISVPAKGYIIRKTTIKFPIGIKGLQKGCFAYSTDKLKWEEGDALSILTRKVRYINISVEGNQYSSIEKIKDVLIANKNTVLYILFIFVIILLTLEIKKLHKK